MNDETMNWRPKIEERVSVQLTDSTGSRRHGVVIETPPNGEGDIYTVEVEPDRDHHDDPVIKQKGFRFSVHLSQLKPAD